MIYILLALSLLLSSCTSSRNDAGAEMNSQVPEGFSTKGGVERDGIIFVMEGEKAREVSTEVGKWLQKIELIK